MLGRVTGNTSMRSQGNFTGQAQTTADGRTFKIELEDAKGRLIIGQPHHTTAGTDYRRSYDHLNTLMKQVKRHDGGKDFLNMPDLSIRLTHAFFEVRIVVSIHSLTDNVTEADKDRYQGGSHVPLCSGLSLRQIREG